MAEKDYLKLSGSFYFDPIKKHILKKQGSTWTFVMHDRRRGQKPVTKDRRARFEAMPIHLKPIAQGLFWDSNAKDVYKKIKENLVLYSKDRRKTAGDSHTGTDRRKER